MDPVSDPGKVASEGQKVTRPLFRLAQTRPLPPASWSCDSDYGASHASGRAL